MKSIPLAYVAWRAASTNRVVVPAHQAGNRFRGSIKGIQIRAPNDRDQTLYGARNKCWNFPQSCPHHRKFPALYWIKTSVQVSGGARTFHLQIAKKVLYHCATLSTCDQYVILCIKTPIAAESPGGGKICLILVHNTTAGWQ